MVVIRVLINATIDLLIVLLASTDNEYIYRNEAKQHALVKQ